MRPINRLLAVADLEMFVRGYAQTIADNAPMTEASIKTIVEEVMKDEPQRDLALCQEVVDRCFSSADYIEGRTAFMENRKPVFTGSRRGCPLAIFNKESSCPAYRMSSLERC